MSDKQREALERIAEIATASNQTHNIKLIADIAQEAAQQPDNEGELISRYESYQNALEEGLALICQAVGLENEHYDDDKPDTEIYLDCFKDAASWLEQAGVRWDGEQGVIAFPQPPKAAPAPKKPDGWTGYHNEFLKLVCLNPGGKLNGGEATHWFEDGSEYGHSISLWELPEKLGLIKCVGSYKWVPVPSRLRLELAIDWEPPKAVPVAYTDRNGHLQGTGVGIPPNTLLYAQAQGAEPVDDQVVGRVHHTPKPGTVELNSEGRKLGDGAALYRSPQTAKPAVPEWLLAMSRQMREQPNRMTAHPFWQVRCKRYLPTLDGYNEHHYEIVGDEGVVYRSIDPVGNLTQYLLEEHEDWCKEWVAEHHPDEDSYLEAVENYIDIDGELPSQLTKIPVQEVEEVVSTHLTQADAEWFIGRKQHDYPPLYTYVESAYWSPQLRQLQDWIIGLTENQEGADHE